MASSFKRPQSQPASSIQKGKKSEKTVELTEEQKNEIREAFDLFSVRVKLK